ncbi:protein of unknown function [Lachnospiraceae bacterium XPB1003]|nr:protein of unknown function [Lachnospiraceae bacterium XPB1003]
MVSDEVRLELPRKLYDRIEEDVVKMHIELELSIPLKPSDIAKRLGFLVRRFSDIASVNNDMMSAYRNGDDGKRRDGISYYDPAQKTYIIWINDLDTFSEEHDEFTIMHEIGHIRMGHKVDSPLAEMIANYYAAYMLVPSPLVSLYKCECFEDICDRFKTSLDCAFNCWNRYLNWEAYFGIKKQYERDLIDYYEKK